MFKTETHLHTSNVSLCARLSASEMIDIYHNAGYKTVFVSDHFHKACMDRYGDIPWTDKIASFVSGYEEAKEAGKKYGMNVILAAEFGFVNAFPYNHYLAYGVTADFLAKCEKILEQDISALAPFAKQNNIFLVQAHPYRDEECFPTPEYVDAIEVYNSNPGHRDFSEKSFELAKKHGLYMTAGSDAHGNKCAARSGVLSECEIKTAQDFIELIKSGKAEIVFDKEVF